MKMECVLRKEADSTEDLFRFVEDFVEHAVIDKDTAFQVTVAAEELFTNLVKYSTKSREPVHITLERTDEWLDLVIVDVDADQFDVTTAALPDLDVPIDKRRHGGMGLHLVRKFADQLGYRHEGGDGIITFRKRLTSQA